MYRKVISTLVVVVGLLLGACDLTPVFNKEPVISYQDITRYSVADPSSFPVILVDSIVINIKFRDGDGDLGLSSSGADTLSPFQDKNADGSINPFFYNYHITPYKKLDGEYVIAEFPQFGGATVTTLNGRFPVLKEDRQPGPIEGDLYYSFKIAPPQDFTNPRYIFEGDTLNFEVFIYDRALHKSNSIRTEDVVLLKR